MRAHYLTFGLHPGTLCCGNSLLFLFTWGGHSPAFVSLVFPAILPMGRPHSFTERHCTLLVCLFSTKPALSHSFFFFSTTASPSGLLQFRTAAAHNRSAGGPVTTHLSPLITLQLLPKALLLFTHPPKGHFASRSGTISSAATATATTTAKTTAIAAADQIAAPVGANKT